MCVSAILSSPYKTTRPCEDLGPTLIQLDLNPTNYIYSHLISLNKLHPQIPLDETFFWGRKLLNPLYIPSGRGLDSPGRGELMVPAFLALPTLQPVAPSRCSVAVAIDARRVSVRRSLFRAGSVVGGLCVWALGRGKG